MRNERAEQGEDGQNGHIRHRRADSVVEAHAESSPPPLLGPDTSAKWM